MKPDTQVPTRAPRTFEMRDQVWVEAGRSQRARPSLWLMVPVVLAALTAAFFVVFAVFAALFTGGLLAARRRLIEAGAALRDRLRR
jgi:predicted phage tail protein